VRNLCLRRQTEQKCFWTKQWELDELELDQFHHKLNYFSPQIFIYISFKTFFYVVRHHCFPSSHWPSFRFLSFMAFLIPSIQFFFGLPRALFFPPDIYFSQICLKICVLHAQGMWHNCILGFSSASCGLKPKLIFLAFGFWGPYLKRNFSFQCLAVTWKTVIDNETKDTYIGLL